MGTMILSTFYLKIEHESIINLTQIQDLRDVQCSF